MANVFERGGRCYYRFFHNGRVHRGSAGAEVAVEHWNKVEARKRGR